MKPSPSLFKKPSLDMARSFNAIPASQSTVNTSFNTISSSQQTQPDTANTSFTSDVDHTEIPYSYTTRTSSTTIGLLDDHDLLNVDARLAKEAVALDRRAEPSSSSSQGRDSSSTWGSSIPEEDLLDVFARVESVLGLSPTGSRRLSPQRQNNQLAASQPTRSPTKNGSFDNARLNQSFPPPPGVSAMLYPDTSLQPRNPANDTSPARTKHSSREQTPVDSPSKVSHHIRKIAMRGLFVDDVKEQALVIPYHILFICQRVAIEWSISLRDLLRQVDVSSAASSPDTLWSALQSHPKGAHIKLRETNQLWSAAKRGLEGFTFKGQINLSDRRRGSIFNLELHPIQADKACRFQRRFGSDRFLYLNTPKPPFNKSGRFNWDESQLILERWNDWLHAEHSFLGRKWRVFHLEPMKRKTKGKKKPVTHDTRIVLFATEGCGIDKCSVRDMVNWFLPLGRNWGESYCKVYARLDLGLSKTIPTLVFKPSQITYVRDILANGETEAAEYNDPTLYWSDVSPDQVMNDGCSIMSVGAAREIWKLYKKATGLEGPLPLPSAFQGRIGGAKGMWMISAESFTKDPDHLAIWIKISDSQLKFKPHEADLSDDTFDPDRLKFEVSNFASAPAPSELHIAFIPILVDRGVPRDVIADYMVERMDADRAELLSRLADPVKMFEYVYRRSASSSDKDVQWQAAMPATLDEKIILLLESGFSPNKLHHLARLVQLFIHQQNRLQESGLRAPLGKATSLYGIADPLGVLKPGEIYVQFSESFVDELTDERYQNLRGHDVVVGRQPACRRSDMQKVQAVSHPDLSHLVDVVVFPSRGQYPLAGKLQGGDYDGDLFWLCWEDRLVTPFTNAPAPVKSPDPAKYGIKQERRKLSDVMGAGGVNNINDFLRASFAFRKQESLLGKVTLFGDKLAYAENGIHSSNLDCIHDVHDLLVDAPKQGYTFTDDDFKRMVQKLQLTPGLPQPAYKEAMDDCMNQKETADMERPRNKQYRIKTDSLLDYLYFEVVRAHNEQTMHAIVAALSSATEPDGDLERPHHEQAEKGDAVVAEELRQLQQDTRALYGEWTRGFHREYTPGEGARLVEGLYARFQALQPHNPRHPGVAGWLTCTSPGGKCEWTWLRASTLYTQLSQPTAARFVFAMAGRELMKLKAEKQPGTRAVVQPIRAALKPRRVRKLASAEGRWEAEWEGEGEDGGDV